MVQRLSKKETDEEGGRYKTETQCLAVVVKVELTERARSSKSVEVLGKISQVSDLWIYTSIPPPCLFLSNLVI